MPVKLSMLLLHGHFSGLGIDQLSVPCMCVCLFMHSNLCK